MKDRAAVRLPHPLERPVAWITFNTQTKAGSGSQSTYSVACLERICLTFRESDASLFGGGGSSMEGGRSWLEDTELGRSRLWPVFGIAGRGESRAFDCGAPEGPEVGIVAFHKVSLLRELQWGWGWSATVHHEQSHGGCGFMVHEWRSSSVSGKGTHDNHALHPHLCFKNSYRPFCIDALQALSPVSSRKAITLCGSSEPFLYQASTVREGKKTAHLVEGVPGRSSFVNCS